MTPDWQRDFDARAGGGGGEDTVVRWFLLCCAVWLFVKFVHPWLVKTFLAVRPVPGALNEAINKRRKP